MNYELITPTGIIRITSKGRVLKDELPERVFNACQYMIDQILRDKGSRDSLNMKCIPCGETKKSKLTTLAELFGKRKPRETQKRQKKGV